MPAAAHGYDMVAFLVRPLLEAPRSSAGTIGYCRCISRVRTRVSKIQQVVSMFPINKPILRLHAFPWKSRQTDGWAACSLSFAMAFGATLKLGCIGLPDATLGVLAVLMLCTALA